jgi:hypothetical protein
LFSNVLKKFFTRLTIDENNAATNMESPMKNAPIKDAMRTLLTSTPRGAVEDMVGLAALFVLLFAVLSLPGLN